MRKCLVLLLSFKYIYVLLKKYQPEFFVAVIDPLSQTMGMCLFFVSFCLWGLFVEFVVGFFVCLLHFGFVCLFSQLRNFIDFLY